VEWTPLVSTIVGAAVALGGTVLAHRIRSRDESGRELRGERRQGYLDFIVALDGAHGALRDVANSDEPDRRHAAARAVSVNDVYEAREKFLLSANPAVITPGEKAFMRLIEVRKAIGDGARLGTPDYHEPYHGFAKALWDLRRAIREDLGGSTLTPADLDKKSWDGRDDCAVCQRGLRAAAAATSDG